MQAGVVTAMRSLERRGLSATGRAATAAAETPPLNGAGVSPFTHQHHYLATLISFTCLLM